MSDLISRQAAIDALSIDKEMLSRVLDNMDVVGTEAVAWMPLPKPWKGEDDA